MYPDMKPRSFNGEAVPGPDELKNALGNYNTNFSEEAIGWLINNTEEACLLIDKDFNVVVFNRQLMSNHAHYFTQKVERGSSIFKHIPENRVEDLTDIFQNALKGAKVRSEYSIDTPGNETRDFAIIYKPAYNSHSEIIGIMISTFEITEKKRYDAQISVNEKRYKALVENGADALVILSAEGKPVYIAPSLERVLGYTEKEAQSLDLFSLTHPDDIEAVGRAWEKALANPGIPVQGSTSRILHKDGTWRWTEDTLINMLHDPSIGGIVDNFRDVTEKVNTESRLRKVISDFNRIMETSADIICTLDLLGNFVQLSDAAQRIWGYSPKELIGTSHRKLVIEEDRLSTIDAMANVVSGKYITDFRNNYRKKDGTVIPMIWSARWNEQEQMMFCIGRDATERVQSEAALKISEEKYKKLFNDNPVPLWMYDCETKMFVEVNDVAIESYGYSRKEFLSMTIYDIRPVEDAQMLEELWINPKDPSAKYSGTWRHKKKNGEILTVEINSHIIDYNGKKATLVMVIDITDKVLALEQKEFERRDKEALINTTKDLMWSVSSDFKLIAANKAFSENHFQFTGNQIKIGDLIVNERTADYSTSFWSALYERGLKESFLEEVKFEAGNINQPYWAEIRFNPIFKGDIAVGIACFAHDITEIKNNNIALLDINQKLEVAYAEKNTVLESIDDGFFAVDNNSNITYWNNRAEVLLNAKREDVIGKNLHELFANPTSMDFSNNYKRAIRENATIHFEAFSTRMEKWFGVSAFPNANGLSVHFKDVTERKSAEIAIKLSNERYNLVAQATNDAIWDLDFISKTVTRSGNGFHSMFGYEKEQAQSFDFWDNRVHDDDKPVMEESQRIVFNDPSESYWESEYRFLKANGHYAYVYDRGYIIRDENGIPVRMIGATQDITQHKKQVNEIIRIQNNLDTLINNTTDLIWSVDNDLRIIAANKSYGKFLKSWTGSGTMEGDPVLDSNLDPEIAAHWRNLYNRSLEGESFSFEYTLNVPEFDLPIVSLNTFTPIMSGNGEITGVACYAKDITELTRSAETLRKLNHELEQRATELAASNSELERFAYIASHDLQEPLRMVSSFLQLLEKKYKPQLDETAGRYIHFAVDGADRMKSLILDLLEYSRVGTSADVISDTDMNDVMREVQSNMQTKIQEVDGTIEIGDLPVIRGARKTQLLQLMQNLVSNSLKYHSDQKPIIKIAAVTEGDHWLFSVKDNGIGFNPKFAEKIFIIFQRLHNKSEYSGTGIGLSICKKIVERHGGKIWAESKEGNGTTFYFTLSSTNGAVAN